MQLAELKSGCLSTFLISKSWRAALNVTDANYHSVKNLLIKLMIHINEYLQTSSTMNRKFISNVIYEGINDLSVLMEKYGMDKLGIQVDTHTPLIWFIASRFNSIFERLKVYKEYRSPMTQRSFTKVMAFILPLLFAPWFAGFAESSAPHLKWLALLYNGLFTFILNGQTIITDRLFNPVDIKSVDVRGKNRILMEMHKPTS
ncbi:hypothetical protein MXB_3170 [Myxobolus squamalis]|nr:hypothetical protein MXB_3170 [Myxobolus squamalis]